MNKSIKFLICHLIILLCSVCVANAESDLAFQTPRELQISSIYDANKKPLELSSLEGNVVVLYFWASWCNSCISTIKELNALQTKLKREKILIIPISLDSKGVGAIKDFYAKNHITALPLFHDYNNKIFTSLNIHTVPTSLVLNTSGEHVATSAGEVDWNSPSTISQLKSFIKPLAGVNESYVTLMQGHKTSPFKEEAITIASKNKKDK